MDLAVRVYEVTASFPRSEVHGLSGQLRRAASAVSANIAEGSGRTTARDFANFLAIARGSLLEVESFLLLSARLNFLAKEDCEALLIEIEAIDKMLTALRVRILREGNPSWRTTDNR